MYESFQECFQRLEDLSNEELDRGAAALVHVECRHMALVIAHLAEISRRKADLQLGYQSLFDYGVRRLGLSEGSVALRIQVANVCRRFPQILAGLAEGRISLSVAGRLAPHLREHNVEELLHQCAGMTKRAVEAYLVRLSPRPVAEPSIRRQPGAGVPPQARPAAHPAPAVDARQEGEKAAVLPPPRTEIQPATPERYNFRFAATADFKAKLERLAEVLGIHGVERNMAEVLERALDLALERKDPAKRLERRVERDRRKAAALAEERGEAAPPRPGEDAGALASTPSAGAASGSQASADVLEPVISRHVPVARRDRVYARAGQQCQYVGPDGTRCTARTGLQVEHEKPFAIHRSHDERHLAAYCARHNQLRAEQAYGVEKVRRKIEQRSRRRSEAVRAHRIRPSSITLGG